MVNRRNSTGGLLGGANGVQLCLSLALLGGVVGCSSTSVSNPGGSSSTSTGTSTSTSTGTGTNPGVGGNSSNPIGGATSTSSAGGQSSQGTGTVGGTTSKSSTGSLVGGSGTLMNTPLGGTSTGGTGTRTVGGTTNLGGTKPVGGSTGSGNTSGSGGRTGTVTSATSVGGTSSATSSTVSTSPIPWINEKGVSGTNTVGIQGNWYAFSDKVTSTQTGNPYENGKYCVTGTAPGDGDSSTHWGVGIGLDMNLVGSDKQAFEYTGKITGFRIKLTGSAPVTPRVQFVDNLDGGVVPFVEATMGESAVYSIADALIPFEWDVTGAGRGVEGGVLYSLQILMDGGAKEGPIDVCIEEFEPIFDPNGNTNTDGPYINRNGFVQASDNAFGIQGPVYAISDGSSSSQVGNPYQDGKYCISGTFSGTGGDDWGAGIAFDLNKLPGSVARESFAYQGKVGGFRMKLTGSTPGPARVQFVIDEPSSGAQPFLAALLNTTMVYRIGWAQVPTSWDVSNQGQEVGASLYTVQLYLENVEAGPFEVCIEEFTPLAEAELSSAGQAAASGFRGIRTVDEAILQQEWESWKKHRLRDCNDGTACVPRDEGDCISEGIGYGMLLASAFDDRSLFDKFWAYYKKHRIQSNGLMTWKTNACGSDAASGTATDGDIDTAFALLQAACKWGGTYESDATTLINSIKTNEVTTCNGKLVLRAGAGYGGCDKTNPSYFAPGYYKVFASVTNDSSWTTLANDSYSLLSTVQGKMNGLVPNWTDQNGNIPSGDDGTYGPDASRTPWRIATDYVWNGEQKAVAFLDNVVKYVDGNSGVQRSLSPNSTYRGPLGLSAVHKDATMAKEYADAWLTTSVDDTTYFPGTLRPIYMLLATQKFSKGCY